MYYIYIIYRERSIQKIGHWENDNGNLEFVKANLKVVQLMKFARKAFIKNHFYIIIPLSCVQFLQICDKSNRIL